MTTKQHLELGDFGVDIGQEVVPAAVRVASAAAQHGCLQITWNPFPWVSRCNSDPIPHRQPLIAAAYGIAYVGTF